MVYRLYTDASYSQHLHIAAVGFLCLKHHFHFKKTVYLIGDVYSSAMAEKQAIKFALADISPFVGKDDLITIRTDQLSLIQKVHKHSKEPKNRPSNSIMEIINLINILQNKEVKVNLKYVKSHADEERKSHHGYHDQIDFACRDILNDYKNKNGLK
jgi:hypothetical protein